MPPSQQQNQWALGGQYGALAGSLLPFLSSQQDSRYRGWQYGAWWFALRSCAFSRALG